jgi:hypothetical protein
MFLAAWPVWGSAPLARSYRGPDYVAGPLLGRLNPALAVVSVEFARLRWKRIRRWQLVYQNLHQGLDLETDD